MTALALSHLNSLMRYQRKRCHQTNGRSVVHMGIHARRFTARNVAREEIIAINGLNAEAERMRRTLLDLDLEIDLDPGHGATGGARLSQLRLNTRSSPDDRPSRRGMTEGRRVGDDRGRASRFQRGFPASQPRPIASRQSR